ncbi:MAG: hypothetical protein ACMUEK_02495 [Sodalis sp. (in: enterobacteria)]
MIENKKEVTVLNFQKNIEEIKIQLKEVKCYIKRVKMLSFALLLVILIFNVIFVCLVGSIKHNFEDKFKLITTEYNKVKVLENKIKKFLY